MTREKYLDLMEASLGTEEAKLWWATESPEFGNFTPEEFWYWNSECVKKCIMQKAIKTLKEKNESKSAEEERDWIHAPSV